MSLLATASVWSNSDTDTAINKKRVPSMNRRTAKKPPSISNSNDSSELEIFEPVAQEPVQMAMQNYYSSSIDDVGHPINTDLSIIEKRNEKVSQLVNKLTAENAGNQLSDFQPLSHPIIQKRTDIVEGRAADERFQPPQNNPLQSPPTQFQSNQNSVPRTANFTAMNQDLGENGQRNLYSNYKNVYDPSRLQAIVQNTNRGGAPLSSNSIDAKLLEKINYMVYLLEQQHNERTSNITEEFVLYTFLGVFIIYIVDAFARSGRYVR